MSEDIIKDLSNMDVSDDQWVYECAQKAIHEIKHLNTENARLREALEQIAVDCDADYPPSHGAIKHAARAALAEKEEM